MGKQGLIVVAVVVTRLLYVSKLRKVFGCEAGHITHSRKVRINLKCSRWSAALPTAIVVECPRLNYKRDLIRPPAGRQCRSPLLSSSFTLPLFCAGMKQFACNRFLRLNTEAREEPLSISLAASKRWQGRKAGKQREREGEGLNESSTHKKQNKIYI